MKKKPVDYVNNQDLFLEMLRYKTKYDECKEKGLTPPPVSNYIGECILLIANRLANNKSFIGYSSQWKEEMISDGIENIIQYLHNFDPDKTNNPFAYFTQIIWYAFLRRLEKEKKQQYVKAKNLQTLFTMDALNGELVSKSTMSGEALNDLIDTFENKKKNKKIKTSKK